MKVLSEFKLHALIPDDSNYKIIANMSHSLERVASSTLLLERIILKVQVLYLFESCIPIINV